jgi:hypothetical protein
MNAERAVWGVMEASHLADAAEREGVRAYMRRRHLAPLIAEALHRAEAAARLEAALRMVPSGRWTSAVVP